MYSEQFELQWKMSKFFPLLMSHMSEHLFIIPWRKLFPGLSLAELQKKIENAAISIKAGFFTLSIPK